MEDKSLLEYFIERTDERLLSIESKLDKIFKFKWQIIGGATVLSAIASFIINYWGKF